MLYAHVVPDEGGETEFADLRAAYDALPTETKSRSRAGRRAFDRHSRGQLDVDQVHARGAGELPPVPQRARAHPSRLAPQDALRRRPRLAHRRHADADGRLLLLRADRARDQPQFVYSPQMAPGRPGDLGQSLHHASRPAVRHDARCATCAASRRATSPRPSSRRPRRRARPRCLAGRGRAHAVRQGRGPLQAIDALELSVPVARHMAGLLKSGRPDFAVWGVVVPTCPSATSPAKC